MTPTDPPASTRSSRSVAAGRLVALDGPSAGQKWTIRGAARLGRALDSDVIIDDPKVSREHAVIFLDDDGRFVLEDLGSSNGTLLEGAPIDRSILRFGDKFRLGPNQLFLFTSHDPVEEQLLQRQRLETLGRLTAGVAHDLNNMLGAVTASASYLRQLQNRDGPEAKECLDDIDNAAQRAADLAAHLLSFARTRIDHEPVSISTVCLDAVRLARRTFERTITIDAQVRGGLFVDGDASQLHQVIMNLLINARDAIEDGGGSRIEVELSHTSTSGSAELTVSDDGRGMDEATQAQIFEPFFTTKREGVGFGVGLATVHDIVTTHGGTIEVESAPGQGSTFRVTLPALTTLDRRRRRTQRRSGGRKKMRQEGRRILLVDDELVLQRSLTRLLRRAGYEVEPFENGEEALERLDTQPLPDLVILDLDLPGIRGQEVLRELRSRGIGTPVVCISGHRDALEDDEETRSEISAFLPKPFDPEVFLRAIEEALSAPSSPEDQITLTS